MPKVGRWGSGDRTEVAGAQDSTAASGAFQEGPQDLSCVFKRSVCVEKGL